MPQRISPPRVNGTPLFAATAVTRGEMRVDPALAPRKAGRPQGAKTRAHHSSLSAALPEGHANAPTERALPPPLSDDEDPYASGPPPVQAAQQAHAAAAQMRSRVDHAIAEGEKHEYTDGELLTVFASGVITGVMLAYMGYRGFDLLQALFKRSAGAAGAVAAALPK